MQSKFLIHPLLVALLTIGTLGTMNVATASINTTQSTDGIVATVNDDIILKSELTAATTRLAAEYQANNINATPAQIQRAALDNLITRKLQLGIINRMGVTPNEAVIDQQMLQIAQSQGFNSLAELQTVLDNSQKGSYTALRNQLIEDAAIGALWQHQLSGRVHISDQEVAAFLNSPEAANITQPQYHLIHIRIPYQANTNGKDDNKAQKMVEQVVVALQNNESLDDILNNTKDYEPKLQGAETGLVNQEALPEYIKEQVSTLPVGGITGINTATGIDILKLVEKNEGRMLISEWQTSHILAGVNETQNNAVAEQKINALYAELQRGVNFAELAANYSDDTGSAQQYGSLGWVGTGQMVPEFEAVMKNTKAGNYSLPFRSQFGWHILKVDNVRQRDITKEYRKNVAREMIFNRIAPQAQEDWIQEMRAAAHIEIFE
ncbi:MULTISPECIES: peptidylprolyl isomerase [unclassified Moraxella]|uniref:peptidylprolyl isomerase n=1 Tax=unclassified Moraxella TaxID=2685852 RepID=UPI002B40567C|nr:MULTISPECIES: peptidylprolyl isomerase [unclassified Moraxella]